MIEFTISTAHNNARLTASAAYADSSDGNSRIEFYDANSVLLGVATLAKPCGVIAADALVLAQRDPTADMVVASGTAVQAAWLTGDNSLVAAGPVTDETGDGPFVLQGATGTQLYTGGRLILGTTRIL